MKILSRLLIALPLASGITMNPADARRQVRHYQAAPQAQRFQGSVFPDRQGLPAENELSGPALDNYHVLHSGFGKE